MKSSYSMIQEPASIEKRHRQIDTWLNQAGYDLLCGASVTQDQTVNAGMDQEEQLQSAREIVRGPAHSLIARGASVRQVKELLVPSASIQKEKKIKEGLRWR